MSGRRRPINELRGFAEGSTSARASLMRDAADALEAIDTAASEAHRPLLLDDMQRHAGGQVRVYSREGKLVAGESCFAISEYVHSLQNAAE